MPFQTTTHIVARAVPGPGQRLVHGRLVGPTDETYPPGTGGPLPNPKLINYVLTKITTVRDMNSGHTHTTREAYVTGTDEATEKAAHRARISPGSSIMVGGPVNSDTAPESMGAATSASADVKMSALEPETQNQMDAHYSRLSLADQHQFLAAYPNYVPGPDAVKADEEPAQGETKSEEASIETESEAQKLADIQAANARRIKQDQAKVGK